MAATWLTLSKPMAVPRPFLQNQTRSGGAALNGMEQTVASGAERWTAPVTLFVDRDRASLLEFERFIAEMDGRANEVSVPFYGHLANWPVDANGIILHPGNTRRKELNGTIYEDAAIPTASTITATTNAQAIGATSCTITVTAGSAISAGQLFSVGTRLYRVLTAGAPSAGAQAITFRPKVRVAFGSGATVILSAPVCLMKFATDDEGRDLDPTFGGPVTLNFVEAF